MFRLFFLVLILLLFFGSVYPDKSPTIIITNDGGGKLSEYIKKYIKWEINKTHVVIDGACYSACTLFIEIIDHDRVCVTNNAVLGFHAARFSDQNGNVVLDSDGHVIQSPSGTALMMDFYSPEILKWIINHGGLGEQLIELKGKELRSMFRSCGE